MLYWRLWQQGAAKTVFWVFVSLSLQRILQSFIWARSKTLQAANGNLKIGVPPGNYQGAPEKYWFLALRKHSQTNNDRAHMTIVENAAQVYKKTISITAYERRSKLLSVAVAPYFCGDPSKLQGVTAILPATPLPKNLPQCFERRSYVCYAHKQIYIYIYIAAGGLCAFKKKCLSIPAFKSGKPPCGFRTRLYVQEKSEDYR